MSETDYKVSVYSSKLGIPLNFVVHTHIVTEHAGTKNRYDVFMPKTVPQIIQAHHGNIYKNLLPCDSGFLLFFRTNYWWHTNHSKKRWGTTLVSSVTGTSGSAAYSLYNFIENEGLEQYTSQYSFIKGPNSNTFVQWVVDQVPECGLFLPWNAWGKGYKIK